MAETMLQVFQRHRDCFDFTKEPNPTASTEARQMCYERQQEREQAANEYVNGILAANDNWADDINEDTNKLALSFQVILNKAERKAYREAAGQFLHYVASALREHRVRQLSPLTRYRMGREEFRAMNIVTGLSRDEAAREYQRMKEQGFAKVYYFPTEAFPAVFTVLGYKPNGSKPHEPQKNAHSGTNGTGRCSNATTTPQTPPAGKETPKIAVLQPYTPKQKGRTAKPFTTTIADKDASGKDYTAEQKAVIEGNIKNALSDMKDPKAVIALFVVFFKNGILKQCPNYWQALSLIDIEGLKDPNEKQKHCPFGMHQRYGKLRNIYFEKDNNYLSLNETDIKQDNEISPFVIEAEKKLKDLQAALKPKKTTTRANKKPAGTA